LTISDRCSRGEAEDTSGKALSDFFDKRPTSNFKVLERQCIPDEKDQIVSTLKSWVDSNLSLILTTGGTGFSPRDVTPEATKAVIEREAPGIVHQMLAKSLEVTPMAMLSRFAAGIKGGTLIVNFPGSKKAAVECLGFVFPSLEHATDLIANNLSKVQKTHTQVQQGHVCPHKMSDKSRVEVGNVAGRVRQSPFPMISVESAQKIVLSHCDTLGTEEIKFSQALGRVLAEDVFARDPLPPFPASIKDGYAVVASDGAGVKIVVAGSTAGAQPASLAALVPGQCVRINTGAPLPKGADAVVQVEDTKLVKSTPDGKEELEIEVLSKPTPGLDVRQIGSDIGQGSKVLPANSRLGAAELGVLATVGATLVKVYKQPKVGLLSTGNELQDPEENPDLEAGQGKIRDSNKTVLKALIQGENSIPVIDLGIAIDEPQLLMDAVKRGLSKCDVLVTTGGVSMGDRDLLRQVLKDDLGAELHFGRVQMKPGKPTTFATIDQWSGDGGKKKLILGLPGNPVSATVTSHLYVLPACRKLSGISNPFPAKLRARVPATIQLDPRPEYQRVVLSFKPGQSLAEVSVTGNQISSRLPSLAAANGLLLLPPRSESKAQVLPDEEVDCLVIGPLLTSQ